MGSPSIPAQPAAPDYSGAYKEGVYADIATLADRRKIEQAAATGGKVNYTDPTTGKVLTADFTGLGDAERAKQLAAIMGQSNADLQRQQLELREELGVKNAQQTAKEIEAADPNAYKVRQDLTDKLGTNLNAQPSNIKADQGLLSSIERLQQVASGGPNYGPGANPMERLGSLYDQATGLNTRVSDGGTGAQLGSIYDEATRLPTDFKDANADALNPALQQALAEYALGGKLSEDEQRSVSNAVRAGQAARGNYLGDAAMVDEVVRQAEAGDAKRQQRLNNLLTVQGQAFGQSDALRQQSTSAAQQRLASMAGLSQQQFNNLLSLQGQEFGQALQQLGALQGLTGQQFQQGQADYQTQLNAAGTGLNAAQAGANENRTVRNENYARDQQNLANASAMVLGQPITNQFGSLQGAQQGAVAFTPLTNFAGAGLNTNAGTSGTQFAQGNYGTAANMWGTSANIASQGSPWMALAGNLLGGLAGGAGAALGTQI